MDDMHTVFSADNLPARRLIVKATLANRWGDQVGREISVMRDKVARQVAQKCVECGDLVEIVAKGPFLSVQADVIVMTQSELADMMRKQFSAGMQHALKFNSPSWVSGGIEKIGEKE